MSNSVPVQIDGKSIDVPAGISIIEAAKMAEIYIPHFCYHPKLSVAANCRMCLVEVEKAPKPLPACATNVTADMVIRTASKKAKAAQNGVMEFLLINHPLDCPICDQGGECQLQDLAVGYGLSNSRYTEPKRVVVEKNLGSLISTDMMRCIHCTRCVRFGQEVAGVMELGLISRGEHAEIMPFVEKTVDSELSGNMIDVCPVGALTSKPFRYTARTWELRSVDGISPHDSWGSNLRIQIKGRKVMRVLPRENSQINECWISDRDRFSYEALNSKERAIRPMVKPPKSRNINIVDWQDALDQVAERMGALLNDHGPESIGFLAKSNMTLEELYLFQKFGRSLGVANLDTRLYQRDFSLDADSALKIPWFGLPIESISSVRQALLIGLNPGNEVPLLGHLLRKMRRLKHANIGSIGQVDMTEQFQSDFSAVIPPSAMIHVLARMLKICGGQVPDALLRENPLPDENHMTLFAEAMMKDRKSVVWLGQQALFNPDYGLIRKLATGIAEKTGSIIGIKNPSGNSIGAYLAGMLPDHGVMCTPDVKHGLNARQMLETPLKGYVLLGCEPDDFFDPLGFRNAVSQADLTVSMSVYETSARKYSDVLLPIAPFTETPGTYVNTEGCPQTFPEAVPPLGEARPGWKVLCVLGKRFELAGFDFDTLDDIRTEIISQGADFTESLDNRCDYSQLDLPAREANGDHKGLERIFEVASYGTDAIVRRAESLQKTRRAKHGRRVSLHPETAVELGLRDGSKVKILAGDSTVDSIVLIDSRLARGCARIPIGVPEFSELGCAERVTLALVTEKAGEVVEV